MKRPFQHAVVIKQFFSTTREEYIPVLYEIEVDDCSLDHITEDSARYIHKELGRLLLIDQGGKS